MKKIALLAAAFILTGCATLNPDGTTSDPLAELRGHTVKSATKAAERAEARNPAADPGAPFRARCYRTVVKYAQSDAPVLALPEPAGVLDAVEIGFEKVIDLKSGTGGVPEDLKANCAYLVDEIKRAGLRGAAKGAGVPGAGLLR